MSTPEISQIIGQGRWSENITWEFVVDNELPPPELCTAVCCITIFQGKLVLIKNKRGWELPAGHIEDTESADQAVRREAREEAGAALESHTFFGYKKLTSLQPVPRRENAAAFYPFPNSFVLFAYATASSLEEDTLPNDVEARELVTYSEALKLFSDVLQYQVILDFLLAQQFIDLAR